ncbi:hypothetical protein H4R27_004530 [Coemansia aciculifera]|nr:hypothetical protein H4R27_004530 [Coemansia aciculifera]
MSSPNGNKLCLDKISRLYPNKALYETHTVGPKTRVELRMLKASAFIRSTHEWANQLNDEEKRQEWTTQVKDTFNLADKEVEYVFEELKYYTVLKENGVGGEELGAIDNVWIINSASNCELAEEFKHNAAVLESDSAQVESNEAALSSGFKALVDPFLYSFSGDNSLLLETPVATPETALDATSPRAKPGSPKSWSQAIKKLNATLSANKDTFDKRRVIEPVRALFTAKLGEEYVCWLPTDFHVNDDGSVTIPSYINNLHPVRYAVLYQTISKVFAKFVPLLEQVTTDIIHPRSLRAVFSRASCITSDMPDPEDIYYMFEDGVMLPEECQEYLYTVKVWHGETSTQEIRLDMGGLSRASNESEIYTEPMPKQFCPSGRPIKPYSMRGLPLQASVEMASINLTPETPMHPEGEWQAVGRAEERVFAVGLYFYDVENIASPKLKFRDPVTTPSFNHWNGYNDFCRVHDVEEASPYARYSAYKRYYSQEVGEMEIKSGSYICYPNFYQTRMPSFELADPTRPGHVKYIAFYIAGPTQRLVSTEIIPPQQPNWAISSSDSAGVVEGMSNLSLDNIGTLEEDKEKSATERAEWLQHLHATCNRNVAKRFRTNELG